MAHKYSVVRPFQRALTAVLPHAQNTKYAVPKRFPGPFPGGRNVLVLNGIDTWIDTTVNDDPLEAGAWEMDATWNGVDTQADFYFMGSVQDQDDIRIQLTGGTVGRVIGRRGGQANNLSPFRATPNVPFHVSFSWDLVSTYLSIDGEDPWVQTQGAGVVVGGISIGRRTTTAAVFYGGILANVKIWNNLTTSPGSAPIIECAIDEGDPATAVINTGTGPSPLSISGGIDWQVFSQ